MGGFSTVLVWDSNNYKWLCTTPRKNEQYFYFSLTLKDTEIFPKLLFLSVSWVTAPVLHNRFLIINLYLMTVVIHSEQRMAITPPHIMLFPQKRNLLLKDPNELGCDNKHDTKWIDEFVCY